MSGNCDDRQRKKLTAPASTMMMAIAEAKIGRSMKKRTINTALPLPTMRRRRRRPTSGADAIFDEVAPRRIARGGGQALCAVGDGGRGAQFGDQRRPGAAHSGFCPSARMSIRMIGSAKASANISTGPYGFWTKKA